MDRTAVIEFEDYPDEWTRVRLDGPFREYRVIYDAGVAATRQMSPENFEALCAALAPKLVEWSYSESCDATGLTERDPNWIIALAREWVMGVRDVPLPLRARSSDGEPSEDQESPSPAT